MTIPDIPVPDKFEPTHTCNGCEVQALVTVGTLALIRQGKGHHPYLWPVNSLTPLPPPLPKARVGYYVLSSERWLDEATSLQACWRYVDDPANLWVAVVKLCADGVLRHVDRDGNEGAPLEVEQ